MSSRAVVPAPSNLDFQSLSDHALLRLRRRAEEPEWKKAGPLITKVAAALVRLKTGGRTLNVELEVPKEIAKALSSGTAKRVGSVVRNAKSGRILKQLKDVKPSQVRRLLKSPMLAFVLVDALQSALLNEKLAAIQQQLKEIEHKLEAQNQGLFRKAIEQMRELDHLKGRNRWQTLHQIRDSLREFEGRCLYLCDNRWEKIDQLAASFASARVTNANESKQLCAIASTVSREVELVVNAKILHAQMTVELGERTAAEHEVLRLQEFLLEQSERFHATFGEGAIIQKITAHRRIVGRSKTARSEARGQLVEPLERMDHLLNSSLLLHLALPEASSRVEADEA